MSGNIKVTQQDLDNYATKFNNESQNMQQMITNMYSYVNELEAAWEGQAAQAFRARLDDLKPSFQNIEDVIKVISEALTKSGTEFANADQQLSGLWS